ncbi:21258_t:CDS:1, partial [Dentiscutata erythropus]
ISEASLISSTTYKENSMEMKNLEFEEKNINEDIVSGIEDNILLQNELHYFFQNLSNKIDLNIDQKIIEDISDEELSVEESLVNLKSNDFDLENLQEITLDNALNSIEGINNPENIVEWPNNAY